MSYDDEKFEPTQEIVFEEDDKIEDFDFEARLSKALEETLATNERFY